MGNHRRSGIVGWNLLRPAGIYMLTAAVAAAGGWVFSALSLPLPWMLGAMAAVMIGKNAGLALPAPPQVVWNAALVVLGVVFGLRITFSTLERIGPYLGPFLGVTAATIAFCIGLGALFAAWTGTDRVSGVFGFIPGGLTEMVITGEAVGARPGTVLFLQTFRLLAVLAVVPFAVTLAFGDGGAAAPAAAAAAGGGGPVSAGGEPLSAEASGIWNWLWYAPLVAAAWAVRRYVPASFVLVPMFGTAAMHLAGLPLPAVPAAGMIAAQVVIGAGLGHSVRLKELRAVGRHWWRVCALLAVLFAVSCGLGFALHAATRMSLPTALLSVAPGGMIEMALTADAVGADAAVVASLQLLRVYFILLAVPTLLRRLFRGRGRAGGGNGAEAGAGTPESSPSGGP